MDFNRNFSTSGDYKKVCRYLLFSGLLCTVANFVLYSSTQVLSKNGLFFEFPFEHSEYGAYQAKLKADRAEAKAKSEAFNRPDFRTEGTKIKMKYEPNFRAKDADPRMSQPQC